MTSKYCKLIFQTIDPKYCQPIFQTKTYSLLATYFIEEVKLLSDFSSCLILQKLLGTQNKTCVLKLVTFAKVCYIHEHARQLWLENTLGRSSELLSEFRLLLEQSILQSCQL